MKLRELLSVLPTDIEFHLLDANHEHSIATIVGNPLIPTSSEDDNFIIMEKYQDVLNCEIYLIRDHDLGLTYVVEGAPYGRVYQLQFELAGYGVLELEDEREEEYEDDEE